MVSIVILVLFLVGILAVLSRRGGLGRTLDDQQAPGGVAPDAGRLMLYLLSLAGLMVFLFAVMGLVSIILANTVFSSRDLISANEAREQGSYYLAALIVATPLWLSFWRVIRSRIARRPEERDAPERCLFFGIVLMATSIVALGGIHTLLRVVFTLPDVHDSDAALKDGAQSFIQLLVYGGALLVSVRTAWRERGITERDPARDLGLYALTLYALGFLTVGLLNALAVVIAQLFHLDRALLLGATPISSITTWGEIAAWVVSGGAVWAAATYLDRRYAGVRAFRIPFLYVALAIAATMTIVSGVDVLYETVRRTFGYDTSSQWDFLRTFLPLLLVGSGIWGYYWAVLRRQADLAGREEAQDTLPWPRRPYLAVLAFAGVAIAAAGAAALLWLVPDALFKAHDGLSSSSWWRDELSRGVALLFVGAPLWLGPWSVLQRAAALDPRERTTDGRRWLLGSIVFIAALAGVGFTVAFLWLLIRLLLGGPHGGNTVGDMLQYLSTVVVTAGLVAYHGTILRRDLRSAAGKAARIRITALLSPDAHDTAKTLSRHIGSDIGVSGYLADGEVGSSMDLVSLEGYIRDVAEMGTSRVFVVLTRDGGIAYPYSRNLPASTPRPSEESRVQVAPTPT